MHQFWGNVGRVLRWIVISAVLVAPIIVYIWTFGTVISNDPNLWSAMGSAMSGIYGPILSVLTFFVLIMQVRMQRETNVHTYEQAYLQNAKADLDFYLAQLVKALEKSYGSDIPARTILRRWYEQATVEQLSGEPLKQAAKEMEQRVPQLQAIWAAIYPIYAGLSSSSRTQFNLHFVSAKQKTIAMISFPTCVALDHYLHCITEGRLGYVYQFSPTLSPST
ncbi:hypothetical protein ACEN88_12505 [Massilia sp. CT11-108]|uniref:hypothetical protein n=1 Tax=Massilia sp. CT11-108 TaxID=3393900 RepID=UPI0039A49175